MLPRESENLCISISLHVNYTLKKQNMKDRESGRKESRKEEAGRTQAQQLQASGCPQATEVGGCRVRTGVRLALPVPPERGVPSI